MTPADHSPDTAARPRWRALAGPLLAAGYAVWCLALLWLHARGRPSTWPIVGLGLLIPVVIALIFIH